MRCLGSDLGFQAVHTRVWDQLALHFEGNELNARRRHLVFSEGSTCTQHNEIFGQHSPERKAATAGMPSRIQITSGLQLATCMASRHGPTNTPSRTSILAARVQAMAIIGGSNALSLPRGRAIDRFSSRHCDSVLRSSWRTIESKVRETTGGQ